MNANATVSTKAHNRLVDLMDVLAESRSVHPGLDKILDGIAELATSDLTVAQTTSVVVSLGGDYDGDVVAALALLAAHLADPDANKSLQSLPARSQERTQKAGEVIAESFSDWEQTLKFTQVAAAIDGV